MLIRFYHNFNLMYSKKRKMLKVNNINKKIVINLIKIYDYNLILILISLFYSSLLFFSAVSTFGFSSTFLFSFLPLPSSSFIRAIFIFFLPSNNPPS